MGLIALAMFICFSSFGSSSQYLRGWVRRSLGTPVDLRLVRLRRVAVESPILRYLQFSVNLQFSVVSISGPRCDRTGSLLRWAGSVGSGKHWAVSNPITGPTILMLRG